MKHSLLQKIEQTLKNKDLDPVENKRLNDDLTAILKRLKKRDYAITNYNRNVFDVADRDYEIYVNIKFYTEIARTWEQILKQLPLNTIHTIIDLCPGFVPKIELALSYLHYKGNVVMYDIDDIALSRLSEFIKLFQYEFTLHNKIQDFFYCDTPSYSLVIGNHIIDDLITYFYAKKKGISYRKVYEEEGALTTLWDEILGNEKESLHELVPPLMTSFDNLVKSGGYLCLAQYPSYTERVLDLHRMTFFCKKIMEKIKEQLLKSSFKDESDIVENSLRSYTGHFGSSDCMLLKKFDL